MHRLSHFRKNVGWADSLKTLFIAILVAGFAILNPEPPYSLIGVTLAVCLPALCRKLLAAKPGLWSSVLVKLSLTIVVAAGILGFFKEHLAGIPGVATALFAVLGFYSSAFFWLWSDPEVVRLDSSSRASEP